MPVLQDGVMATVPSWDELSDIDKASRVARRLLWSHKFGAGMYLYVHAAENLWTGDLVVIDELNNARNWDGVGLPHGIAMPPMGEGCFGMIQTKS